MNVVAAYDVVAAVVPSFVKAQSENANDTTVICTGMSDTKATASTLHYGSVCVVCLCVLCVLVA